MLPLATLNNPGWAFTRDILFFPTIGYTFTASRTCQPLTKIQCSYKVIWLHLTSSLILKIPTFSQSPSHEQRCSSPIAMDTEASSPPSTAVGSAYSKCNMPAPYLTLVFCLLSVPWVVRYLSCNFPILPRSPLTFLAFFWSFEYTFPRISHSSREF